jgi:Phosphate-starvation-inducible E family
LGNFSFNDLVDLLRESSDFGRIVHDFCVFAEFFESFSVLLFHRSSRLAAAWMRTLPEGRQASLLKTTRIHWWWKRPFVVLCLRTRNPDRFRSGLKMADEKIRVHFGDYLGIAEVTIYSVLAVLLFITALATIGNAGKILWEGVSHWTIAAETLRVLDQLLVVLMLVEILHTVRISIRSHYLVTEPFLVVGLIASIRRILVITLEAATLTKGGTWSVEGASIFRASMIELGLLGSLVLVLVFSITLLRRFAPPPENVES